MTPQDAVKALYALKWTDRSIATRITSSKSVINRIRLGETKAPHHLGLALIALARKEQKKQEKANGTHNP